VTYISEQDKGALEKGSELPLVLLTSGLDICAAVLGPTNPEVGIGCGVVKSVIDIVNGIVKEMEDNDVKNAIAGSVQHGEGSGIAIHTVIRECMNIRGGPACGSSYTHVYSTKYMPL
jgi:hypothetical protein